MIERVTQWDPEFGVFEGVNPFAQCLSKGEPRGQVEQILEAVWGTLWISPDLQQFLELSLRRGLLWQVMFPEAGEILALIVQGLQRLIGPLTGFVWVMGGRFAGLKHPPALAGALFRIGRSWLLGELRPLRRRRET
jgi:hypothetical protein